MGQVHSTEQKINANLSLKQRKSAENIVQKHYLEYSQKSDGKPQQQAGAAALSTEPQPRLIDPKLKLLDDRLRHILHHDSLDGAENLSKKDQTDVAHYDGKMPGNVMHRSLELEKDEKSGGLNLPNMSKSLEREDLMHRSNVSLEGGRHSTEMKDSNVAIRLEQSGKLDGNDEDMLILECSQDSKIMRKQQDKLGNESMFLDSEVGGADRAASKSNLAFGGVDEKSYNTCIFTQACMGDEPTQAYDNVGGNKLAPCTVVTQFNMSMASSEEESDGEESLKGESPFSKQLSSHSQHYSPYSDYQKRGVMMKQMQDVSERLNEKLHAREIGKSRRELFHNIDNSKMDSEADSIGANTSRSAHKDEYRPVKSILEEIPRPKYSTHSPGSPAKSVSSSLSSKPGPSPIKALPVLSKVKEVSNEFVNSIDLCSANRKSTTSQSEVKSEKKVSERKLVDHFSSDIVLENKLIKPHAVPDDLSGSDTEASRNLLDKEAIKEKLLALKLEERGVADGESPRQNSGDEEADIKGGGIKARDILVNKDNLSCDDKEAESLLIVENGPIISVPFSPIVTRVPDVISINASLDRGPLNSLGKDFSGASPVFIKSSSPVLENIYKNLNKEISAADKDEVGNVTHVSKEITRNNFDKETSTIKQSSCRLDHSPSSVGRIPVDNKGVGKIINGNINEISSIMKSNSDNVTPAPKPIEIPSPLKVNSDSPTHTKKSIIHPKSRLPVRDSSKPIRKSSENEERTMPPSPKKSIDGPKKSETVIKRERSSTVNNDKLKKTPTKSSASPSRAKGVVKKDSTGILKKREKPVVNGKTSSIPVKGSSPQSNSNKESSPKKVNMNKNIEQNGVRSKTENSMKIESDTDIIVNKREPTTTFLQNGNSPKRELFKESLKDNANQIEEIHVISNKDKNKNPLTEFRQKQDIFYGDDEQDGSSQASSTRSNSPRGLSATARLGRSRSKKRNRELSKERPTYSMIAGGGGSQADDISMIRASVDVYMMDGDLSEFSSIRPKPPPGNVSRNARVSSRAR